MLKNSLFRIFASIFKTILRDKIFFDMSGGGITLSGGEPLMQPAFARDLLQKSKSHGIHTAIETCGYAEWGAFEMETFSTAHLLTTG